MTQSKNDLIENIATQMATQLTNDYFNRERPQNVLTKVLNGSVSELNRVFDALEVDEASKTQLYQLAIASKDPVNDILMPLVRALSKKVLDPKTNELKADIQTKMSYTAIQNTTEDQRELKNIILRAIASACSSIIVDEQIRLANKMRKETGSSGTEEEKNATQNFSNKITLPFDAYINKLTIENFFGTGFLNAVYQGLMSIVNYFLTAFEKPIDSRVTHLHKLITIAHNNMVAYQNTLNEEDREALSPLVEKLDKFKADLDSLKTEITDSIEFGIPYEEKSKKRLQQLGENFSSFAVEQISAMKPERRSRAGSISQKVKTMFAEPKTPVDVLEWLTNADPLLITEAKKKNIELTKLPASEKDSNEHLEDDDHSASRSSGFKF